MAQHRIVLYDVVTPRPDPTAVAARQRVLRETLGPRERILVPPRPALAAARRPTGPVPAQEH